MVANLDLYDSKRKWGKKGISYELRCGKGKMLYMHFYSQMEFMEEEYAKREMTRKAYYLSELFYRENNRQQIKEYYEKTYGEIIE